MELHERGDAVCAHRLGAQHGKQRLDGAARAAQVVRQVADVARAAHEGIVRPQQEAVVAQAGHVVRSRREEVGAQPTLHLEAGGRRELLAVGLREVRQVRDEHIGTGPARHGRRCGRCGPQASLGTRCGRAASRCGAQGPRRRE
jgi:hypothetical protein